MNSGSAPLFYRLKLPAELMPCTAAYRSSSLIQREFCQLIGEAVAGGATVFLSSHVLSEVELICDRIGLIRDGRLRRVGSLNDLRALRIHQVEARVTGRLAAEDLEAGA